MSVELASPEDKTVMWTRRHLLGLEDLGRDEVVAVLDRAEDFVDITGTADRPEGQGRRDAVL